MIDLFDVVEVQNWQTDHERGRSSPQKGAEGIYTPMGDEGGVDECRGAATAAAPTVSDERKTENNSTFTLLMHSSHQQWRKVHMRFTVRDYEKGNVHVIDPSGQIRERSWRVEASRTFARSQQWLVSIRDMVRELTEPDPPPSFQPVRIWVGTWNMGNAPPDSTQLGQWFGTQGRWFGSQGPSYDLYAIGLQARSAATACHSDAA